MATFAMYAVAAFFLGVMLFGIYKLGVFDTKSSHE
jgi:hypothetical protein